MSETPGGDSVHQGTIPCARAKRRSDSLRTRAARAALQGRRVRGTPDEPFKVTSPESERHRESLRMSPLTAVGEDLLHLDGIGTPVVAQALDTLLGFGTPRLVVPPTATSAGGSASSAPACTAPAGVHPAGAEAVTTYHGGVMNASTVSAGGAPIALGDGPCVSGASPRGGPHTYAPESETPQLQVSNTMVQSQASGLGTTPGIPVVVPAPSADPSGAPAASRCVMDLTTGGGPYSPSAAPSSPPQTNSRGDPLALFPLPCAAQPAASAAAAVAGSPPAAAAVGLPAAAAWTAPAAGGTSAALASTAPASNGAFAAVASTAPAPATAAVGASSGAAVTVPPSAVPAASVSGTSPAAAAPAVAATPAAVGAPPAPAAAAATAAASPAEAPHAVTAAAPAAAVAAGACPTAAAAGASSAVAATAPAGSAAPVEASGRAPSASALPSAVAAHGTGNAARADVPAVVSPPTADVARQTGVVTGAVSSQAIVPVDVLPAVPVIPFAGAGPAGLPSLAPAQPPAADVVLVGRRARDVVAISLSFLGRRKHVIHMASTVVGDIIPTTLGVARERLVVIDRHGYEVATDVPLGLLARQSNLSGSEGGPVELTLQIDEWAEGTDPVSTSVRF
uniref:Uncharacterized protein n=2 Tax=Alexandrium monilatum TaxID=311494 RepID=A0A7S4VLF5_9DINO